MGNAPNIAANDSSEKAGDNVSTRKTALMFQKLRTPSKFARRCDDAYIDDRGILDGIFWVLRSGAPWRYLPDSFGPHTTCYNRFVRWLRGQ